MKSLLIAVIAFSANLAFANNSKNFLDLVEKIQESEAEYQTVSIDLQGVNKKVLAQLLKLANKNSQIWGDTILEGDYIASQDELVLESFEKVVTKSGKLVAYKMEYSLRAWNTFKSTCSIDWNKETYTDEDFKGCSLGKIWDSAYVSLNLEESIYLGAEFIEL